ncbi:hypothetical protein [Bradyrhizobium sp. LHD-71]|uniref:hypothetical protein n=1 Tax=Bradyrhizobium sp. LHD-71 TaxID=3072141 RepID=UPI00280CE68A|nr:hypothetical protein [Bradyrhizobium sp. LHD-71]MDQ8729236.1 hypothetical protein [Bradyrhizobium sp. LHD-71]
MAEAASRFQIQIARISAILIVALLVLGLIWYGTSLDVHRRIWSDIIDRPQGPMAFRFILQPVMAAICALHDGIHDARLGRNPYLWTILTDSQKSADRIREGLLATGRIIMLGLVMDGVYQAVVLKTFYPGEMVIVSLLLAFVPYLLLRGPVCRLFQWWLARNATDRTP